VLCVDGVRVVCSYTHWVFCCTPLGFVSSKFKRVLSVVGVTQWVVIVYRVAGHLPQPDGKVLTAENTLAVRHA
jgi:hypothetical protein